VPLAELVTDLRVGADVAETQAFMQADASRIRLGNAGGTSSKEIAVSVTTGA